MNVWQATQWPPERLFETGRDARELFAAPPVFVQASEVDGTRSRGHRASGESKVSEDAGSE